MAQAEGNPKFAAGQMSWLQRKLEIARHDADDNVGLPVQQDLLAENLRIRMEAAFPGCIAQNHKMLVVLFLLRREEATDHGCDSQGGKNTGAESRCIHIDRLHATGQFIYR